MKHDPAISKDQATQAVSVRAFVPDPDQCNRCSLNAGDCSRLAFDEMPLVSTHDDGFALVACVQFEDQSTPITDEA